MSVEKLKEKAVKAFEADKSLDKVFVSEDGNVFQSKNYADLHATTNGKNKKQKVFEFTKQEVVSKKEATKDVKPSVEDRVKTIEKLTTVEAVEEYLKGERTAKVKAAGTARIETLKNAAKKGNAGSDSPEKRGDNTEGDKKE